MSPNTLPWRFAPLLARLSSAAWRRAQTETFLLFALPGDLLTRISGIGIFYPDKRPTQRIGIVPDVEVMPTIAGIRAGRDEVLEEALRQILGPDAPQGETLKLVKP